jgi:hypothetical protein
MEKQNKKIEANGRSGTLRSRDALDEADRLYAADAEASFSEFRENVHPPSEEE